MTRLLYIQSSPREESRSTAVAREYLDTFRVNHPQHEVETLDLWRTELPRFDGNVLKAKYRVLHGQPHLPEEAEAWKAIVQVAERFKAADMYLISVPMWNFSIPYVLKHYIDVITQPGITFHFSPETGYSGLVKGRPATVIYARGGAYGDEQGQGLDFQIKYMNLLLGFIGIVDVRTIVVEPTLGDKDLTAERQREAMKQARTLAAEAAAPVVR